MQKKMQNSISGKLMIIIIVIVAFTGITVGGTGYFLAKKQLTEAGKSQLKQIVEGSLVLLDELNTQVKNKELTLDEAKEKARQQLLGPKLVNNEGYDFTQSSFSYKNEGYLVAYGSDYSAQLHPTNPVGQISDDTTDREKMVQAAQSPQSENHYYIFSDEDEETGKYKNKIAYMENYEPWGWNVGIIVFEDEFYSELHIVRNYMILITVSIAFLSILLFYFASKKKLRLLREVTSASINVSNGNIVSAKLPEAKDEIGQLGFAYNQMSDQLRQLINGLQNTSNHLLESANDLSAVSEETLATSEEIGMTISEISSGALAQSTDLAEIDKSVSLLNQSLERMNDHNNSIKEMTNNSEAATHHGKHIIMKLKESNSIAFNASTDASIGVANLSKKVKDISRITDTIESIASETNLLALNASIEAARAGENGKGFAVVANEVRKLAEQSNQATKQIQQMITAIETETDKTVLLMTDTIDRSQDLKDSVIETENEFLQISSAISQTKQAVESLSKELEILTNQNKSITTAINNASSVAEQSASSVEAITTSIDEQIIAISNISTSAENLCDLSQKLTSMIKKYHLK
ncbi:methyl-accepting chemotaxis protein [Metabacillus bambusae]|uniref:Cache domain-containing protein n=1 Tax=Metabacillus bambusae TaxID=2795218 RepID=A0ABS3MZT8_9BACI|nr:methyl-accepting chemotaxis protein [Metabacillus bambusae]MBO1511499.1 cache domain-containing protein [Metabacillus bambusae]